MGNYNWGELMPKCPNCGTELELRKFVDSWDSENKPCDINEDLYCPKCQIRWLSEHPPHHFYKETKEEWYKSGVRYDRAEMEEGHPFPPFPRD